MLAQIVDAFRKLFPGDAELRTGKVLTFSGVIRELSGDRLTIVVGPEHPEMRTANAPFELSFATTLDVIVAARVGQKVFLAVELQPEIPPAPEIVL